jgi:hypothetical protein
MEFFDTIFFMDDRPDPEPSACKAEALLMGLSLPARLLHNMTLSVRFAPTTVGPISTLCKAAELPPGRMPLQSIRSLLREDQDV